MLREQLPSTSAVLVIAVFLLVFVGNVVWFSRRPTNCCATTVGVIRAWFVYRVASKHGITLIVIAVAGLVRATFSVVHVPRHLLQALPYANAPYAHR